MYIQVHVYIHVHVLFNIEEEGKSGVWGSSECRTGRKEKCEKVGHCTFLPTHAHTPLVSFWTVQCVAGSPPRSPPLSEDAQTVTVLRPTETHQLPASGRVQHFIQ